MLDHLIKDIDEQVLDNIIVDSFNWLVDKVGDNSVRLNNINFRKVRNPFSKKRELLLRWSYSRKELGLKREYLALMDYRTNQIKVHCRRNASLGTILDLLFHEYRHSQQSSYLYVYHTRREKIGYYEHPLERDAIEFAEKMVPVYWQESSWKFEKESLYLK
jgi:hypothetical protein